MGQNQMVQSVYRADADGRIAVWDIPDVTEKSIAALMQEQFKEYPGNSRTILQNLSVLFFRSSAQLGEIFGRRLERTSRATERIHRSYRRFLLYI